MLLHRLATMTPLDTEKESGHTYARERLVRWSLELNGDGTLDGVDLLPLEDPDQGRRAKLGLSIEIPHASRTSGIAPCLGADDIQYVLGWVDDKSKPDRVRDAHDAFVALHEEFAAAYPDDVIAQAIAAFYASGAVTQIRRPATWTSKDSVVITVDGARSITSDNLWRFWSDVVEGRKSGAGQGGETRRGVCLVCGQVGALLDRLPQQVPKSLVPGADQDVALVSANRAIHTYDHSTGLGMSPICTNCGQRAVTNLHSLLADKDHVFRFGDEHTALAWWTVGDGDTQLIRSLQQKNEWIAKNLSGVRTGQRLPPTDTSHFLSATVSGNVSRLIVHDWVEMPLGGVNDNIEQWYDDHQIASLWSEADKHFSMWALVGALGRWDDSGAHGSYARLGDKSADRPQDAAHLLLRAALRRAPLPVALLGHLIRRIRVDGRTDDTRAGLLRLLLIRQNESPKEKDPMPALDDDNHSPSYVAGRIFAVLESLQRSAYPGKDAPNLGFYGRYYSGAIANPNVALVAGEQLSAAWVKKLEGRGQGGIAFIYKNRLTDLYERIDEAGGIPARIGLTEQGSFILGYHHQRADDLRRARAGKAPEVPAPPEDTEEPVDTDQTSDLVSTN